MGCGCMELGVVLFKANISPSNFLTMKFLLISTFFFYVYVFM